MKKILTLASLLAISASLILVGNTVTKTDAEIQSLENTAEKWEVFNGSPSASTITGGVQINGLSSNTVGMYYKDKIALDGLSMTFRNIDGPSSNGCGFFFSTKTTYSVERQMYNLWHEPWGSKTPQARFCIAQGIGNDDPSTNYTTEAFTATGFEVAASMVNHNSSKDSKYAYDGHKIEFKKLSSTTWKVTFTELISGSMWNNNSNYSNGTCYTFLKNEQVAGYLDSEGKAYLHVYACQGGGANNGAQVLDLKANVVPDLEVDKSVVQGEVDAITEDMINEFFLKPELRDSLLASKTAANEFLKTAPSRAKRSVFKPANDFITEWNERFANYGYIGGTESMEANAPFINYKGKNGGQTTPSGDFQVSFERTYGRCIYTRNEFDATNLTIHLNVCKLPIGDSIAITINPKDKYVKFVDQTNQYYHFIINRVEEGKLLIVLGNTTTYKKSISGFDTDTSGDYTGKFLETGSGDISLNVKTVFATNTTTININRGKIVYTLSDNSILFKGEHPTSKVSSKWNLGLFGDNGDTSINVMFLKLYSPDVTIKEYTKGSKNDLTLPYDLSGETKTTLTMDGNNIPEGAILDTGNELIVYAKYLDTLTSGNHTLHLASKNNEVDWTINVIGLVTKDIPWTRKGAMYVKKAEITDISYPLDTFGLTPNEMTIKLDDGEFDSSNYIFEDFNTLFTVKASAINSWSIGKHVITIAVDGVSAVLKIKITILA